MNDNAEISALGTLTVILASQKVVDFSDVPEDYADSLLLKYRERGAGPFWIKQPGKRLMQFPYSPPLAVYWEQNK